MKKLKVQIAQVFPSDVISRLLAASEVDMFTPPGDSLLREKAVARATEYAKQRCPELFKKEF
jgi:hypothetical protein